MFLGQDNAPFQLHCEILNTEMKLVMRLQAIAGSSFEPCIYYTHKRSLMHATYVIVTKNVLHVVHVIDDLVYLTQARMIASSEREYIHKNIK